MLLLVPFTLMHGFNGALDTLMSQAYGAGQYEMAGHLLNTGRFLMALMYAPVFVLLLFTGPILRSMGQDEKASDLAQEYMNYLLPGIFFMYFYDVQRR